MRYIIEKRGRFYRWSDEQNDVVWENDPQTATVWTNRRQVEGVTRIYGGRVVCTNGTASVAGEKGGAR